MGTRSVVSASTVVFFLVGSLLAAGCGGGGGSNPATSATITVQLSSGLTDYAVDGMTVTIQKAGSPELTAVTDTTGAASFTVPAGGIYSIVKVEGVDATSLAEGSEGREFVKASPLANPFPSLSYTPPGAGVDVGELGQDYPVTVVVPAINRVTVLKKGTAAADGQTGLDVPAGTTAFNGRLVFTNLSFDDTTYNIAVRSTHVNGNCFALSPGGGTPVITGSDFWGGPSWTGTPLDASGQMNSWLAAGPIYFEAPGGGDWAVGYDGGSAGLTTREGVGGAAVTRDFTAFNGGGSAVFELYFTGHASTHTTFRVDYSVQEFDAI